MKRLAGNFAVLLLMAASVVVSAASLRSVRPQPVTTAPLLRERVFRARLLFAGDVMAHLPQLAAARRADGAYDFYEQFRYVRPRFEAADLVVVNLETTLSPTAPYTGYPCFRTPLSLARALPSRQTTTAVTAVRGVSARRSPRSTMRAFVIRGPSSIRCGIGPTTRCASR